MCLSSPFLPCFVLLEACWAGPRSLPLASLTPPSSFIEELNLSIESVGQPMGTVAKDRDPVTYLTASGLAALINFPLWKAAAIGQSGFASQGTSLLASARILFGPPYKGVAATLFGMTWARAAIFYGCDVGKDALLSSGHSMAVASWLPSIVISTFVQVANLPTSRSRDRAPCGVP